MLKICKLIEWLGRPYLFSDRISRFMIKYSMRKTRDKKKNFKKKLSKIIYKGINV